MALAAAGGVRGRHHTCRNGHLSWVRKVPEFGKLPIRDRPRTRETVMATFRPEQNARRPQLPFPPPPPPARAATFPAVCDPRACDCEALGRPGGDGAHWYSSARVVGGLISVDLQPPSKQQPASVAAAQQAFGDALAALHTATAGQLDAVVHLLDGGRCCLSDGCGWHGG